MSYDAILARSPSIIYQPGGTPGGLVVTTWAQVQKFIAARQGSVTVFVDSSIVSPAPVDAATGITECFGRVVLQGALIDSLSYNVLQIEAGATLQNLYEIIDLNVACNTTTAVPALSFTSAPNGGYLALSQYALLSNTATATMPAIAVAAGKTLLISMNLSGVFLHAPAVPLFDVPATATLNLDLFDGSGVPPGYATGAGNVNLFYDNSSATYFTPSGVVPALPVGLTYFTQNIDDIWVNKVLDPTTMGAPVVGDVPVFNADGTWHAAPPPSGAAIVVPPANGSWSQAVWFWDPSNVSGLASDANSGLDALHPVLTYTFGIAARWETYYPQLKQQTTITMMSSQPASLTDPVILDPIMYGTYLLLQGQLGSHQQVNAGVFGAVTPKNTSTGQQLEVNLGFAASVGQLVQNMTHPSFAYVVAVAGNVATMLQPLTPVVPPASVFTTFPTEVNTWAPGDTYTLWQPCTVYLVEGAPRCGQEDAVNVLEGQLQLYHVAPIGTSALADENSTLIGNIVNIECCYNTTATTTGDHPLGGNVNNFGTFYNGGIIWSTDDTIAVFNGGGVLDEYFGVIRCAELALGAAFITTGPQLLFGSSNQFVHWEEVYLGGNNAILFALSGGHEMFDAASLIWGSGGLFLFGTASIYYHTGSATTTFEQLLGFSLNESGNAVAFDQTTGLWTLPIAITPAALDLPVASGGFGGHATQPGGPSISIFPPGY